MLGFRQTLVLLEAGVPDIVNLNKFRKAKRKQEQTAKAQENRIIHGLTKTQKAVARFEKERTQVQLEESRLDQASEIKTVDDPQ